MSRGPSRWTKPPRPTANWTNITWANWLCVRSERTDTIAYGVRRQASPSERDAAFNGRQEFRSRFGVIARRSYFESGVALAGAHLPPHSTAPPTDERYGNRFSLTVRFMVVRRANFNQCLFLGPIYGWRGLSYYPPSQLLIRHWA